VLNLIQLRHAAALGREQNFARAAAELELSQPALTRSIQSLERELGVKLFDRQPRRTVPTAFGALVLKHADEMLRRAAQLKRDVDKMAALEVGELRVGSGPYPARTIVGPALAELCAKNSRFRVHVTIDSAASLKDRLLQGEIDLFIGDHVAEDDKRLDVIRLKERPTVLYCRSGHPLTKNEGSLHAADILHYPIGYPNPRPDQQEAGRALVQEQGLDALRRTTIVADEIALLVSVVRSSDCVAFATPDAIVSELRHGLVAILPYALPTVFGSLASVVRLKDSTPSPLARVFITAIRQHDASEFILEHGAMLAAGGEPPRGSRRP
jgi:DNA-binding transcriptional LysR family regulator